MLGVWVNAAAVVAGGLAGLLLRGALPRALADTVRQGMALCVLVIGVMGAITTQNSMLVILSVVAGSVIGSLIGIEGRLERLGELAKRRFGGGDARFSQGFVSATLLFCVGSMAVVGSMEAGVSGKADTLMAKSALDGVSALIFASALGPGVLLSAVPLTIYQGGIALLSRLLGSFLPEAAIVELSATGGVLIMGVGLNMLGLDGLKLRVGDMLPSLIIPAVYMTLTATR